MVPVLRTCRPCARSASAKFSKALIRNIFGCESLAQARSRDAVAGAVDGFDW